MTRSPALRINLLPPSPEVTVLYSLSFSCSYCFYSYNNTQLQGVMPLQQNLFVQTIIIKEKIKWLTIIFSAAAKVSPARP